MRLRDAIIMASNEYDAECRQFKRNPDLNTKAMAVLHHEYDEIEATTAIGDVLQGRIFMPPEIDDFVRIAVVMAIRLGMRAQRKLAAPEVKTSIFDQPEQTIAAGVQ